MSESDTPRTEAESYIANDPAKWCPDFEYVHADFARALERELSSEREHAKRLTECLDFSGRGDVPKGWDAAIERAERAERENAALRLDKERLDWLEKHANFIEVGHGDISPTRAEIDLARQPGGKNLP